MNRYFMGWLASHSIFLFIDNAVGFVLRLFISSQERYLPFGGISIHLKDFNALERKIYNKREVLIMVHPFQYIITTNQQNTLMVSISGHSDWAQTFLLVKYSMAHIMGMTLNVSLTTLSVIP